MIRSMIQLGNPDVEMDPALLRAPGGFAWWYLDLLDPSGDGLVLIWAYGLPFLPGYADAARRGAPQLPVDRPSINVVSYRGGRADFYLLQEYGEPPASSDQRPANRPAAPDGTGSWQLAAGSSPAGSVLRIGESVFASRVEEGKRVVEVELDCEVPGSAERLTGAVRLEGVARAAAGEGGAGEHLWTPLTGPSQGEAELWLGAERVGAVRGRGYHDRNGGSVPLHDLGIRRWVWGRFPLRHCEWIYYLLWPEGGAAPRFLVMRIGEDGVLRPGRVERVEWAGERRSLAGVRWPTALRLRVAGEGWYTVRHLPPLDVGPFYLRFQSWLEAPDGERARGWGELCVPARVDLPLHRPLVRMRVHRVGGRNSAWLPLFTGPRAGRVGRLIRGMAGRG